MSLSMHAARAKVGTANASPVSSPTGTARSTHHDAKAPNSAATATKIAVATTRWTPDDREVADRAPRDAQGRGEHRGIHLVPRM